MKLNFTWFLYHKYNQIILHLNIDMLQVNKNHKKKIEVTVPEYVLNNFSHVSGSNSFSQPAALHESCGDSPYLMVMFLWIEELFYQSLFSFIQILFVKYHFMWKKISPLGMGCPHNSHAMQLVGRKSCYR